MWSDRKKTVEVPVIPMIVFIKIDSDNDDIRNIITYPLVIKILTLPGEKSPAKIAQNEIDNLQFLLGQSEIPVSFEFGKYSVKDNVRIIRGNLQGIVGEIIAITDDMTTIRVIVDLLGGAIVQIKRSDILPY